MKQVTFVFCAALLSACSQNDSSNTTSVNRDVIPPASPKVVLPSVPDIASSPQSSVSLAEDATDSLAEEDTGPEATPLDTRNISWVGMGGVPGIQQVNSIVTSGNKVYVAGLITSNISNGAGPSTIAVWDGASWNELEGVKEHCGLAQALAVDKNGNVYANVCMKGINNQSSVLKWNGKEWQTLGDGIDGEVSALAIDKLGNVYATGGNLQGEEPGVGYIYSGFVMKWDGITWSKLGGGILKGGNEHGATITIDSRGYVYVGGSFESVRNVNSMRDFDEGAGDIEAHNIVFWDGSKWNAMGTDAGGLTYEDETITQHTEVSSIAFDSKGTPYVAGLRGIEKWDGKKWETLSFNTISPSTVMFGKAIQIGKNDFAHSVFSSTCNVKERSEHPIKYWNGSKWNGAFKGSNSGVNPGCVIGLVTLLAQDDIGNLVVGGAFTEITSGARNIAKWNGKNWESFGKNVGVNDIVHGMVVDIDGNLYVYGAFTRVDDIVVKKNNQIAKWNENKWSVLKATDDPIFNMKTDQKGNLYVATGHHTDQYNDGGISRISVWDGANWIKIAEINYLINSFIVDSQGKIYTCGYTGDESDHYGETTLHGVDMWDGKAWTHLPENDFKVAGYNCEFKLGKSDELYASNGEDSWRWDGATWIKQNPLPNFGSYVTEWKGNYFNITRENYNEGRNIISVKNKTTGEIATLGATSFGSIGNMVASENFLYVGGSFLRFDSRASPYLARFELKPNRDQLKGAELVKRGRRD